MKFLPTVNLWNNATQKAVLSGQLKLQCGQWVQCGEGHKSRFVCINGCTLWVAHWQGTSKATKHRFNALNNARKNRSK